MEQTKKEIWEKKNQKLLTLKAKMSLDIINTFNTDLTTNK